MPERSRWMTGDLRQSFVADAIAARGFVIRAGEDDEPLVAEPDPSDEPKAGGNGSPRSSRAAMTAIADATGQDIDELADIDFPTARDVIDNDLTDPIATYGAIADAEARSGAPTYRAQEGAFMADKGLQTRRSSGHVRPSRTPEARRRRHLRGLVDAGKYPDLATADANTQRRSGSRSLTTRGATHGA